MFSHAKKPPQKKSNYEAFEDVGARVLVCFRSTRECELHLSVEDSRLSHIPHFVCFGRAVSLPLCTSTKPLAGFAQRASSYGANARQTGRQIHRVVKTDSQIDTGKNPWLWSRKQCQMLLVTSTYNHLVRHVSPRTSKYILYTRAKSALRHVATPLAKRGGASDDNNCTKRYSGGHVYCEHTHTHTHPNKHTHNPP